MRSALTAALVAAIVASGSAVAATKLIDGRSIQNHSIPSEKLTKAAIASLQGARGPRGATGATGPTGPQGPQGPPGNATTFTLVKSANVDVAPGDTGSADAKCPAGEGAVSGGWFNLSGFGDVVDDAWSTDDGTTEDGYIVVIHNPSSTQTVTFHAEAVCVRGPLALPTSSS